MTSTANVYSTSHIQVLSGLEAVRKRPGMYVGDTHDGSGLHNMLWLAVGRALDEHREGCATRIRVSVEGQLAEVEDDGAGIPVEKGARSEPSGVEALLTQLGHVSDIFIVNALSDALEIETRRDGYAWHQRYARGVPLGPLERGGRTERTGTRLRFHVDPLIFGNTPFDRPAIRERLYELAAFHPTLCGELMTERIEEPRGLAGWVARLSEGEELGEVFAASVVRGDLTVDVAVGWSNGAGQRLLSFVGEDASVGGGTHENGFWKGLIGAIGAQHSLSRRVSRVALARPLLRRGLRAIVNVRLPHPSYAGSTRDCLTTREADPAVRAALEESFGTWLGERPALSRALARRLVR